jgi:hypothetical protein
MFDGPADAVRLAEARPVAPDTETLCKLVCKLRERDRVDMEIMIKCECVEQGLV